ncbi:Fe superoxide dismutase-like protein [Amniculicola lignicola CBS 123094]|uniref:Fe superoxide dismutase-like protein n=1 Tax=Amniculicola lignicola CBS 123094 TaxID=1392246 RepID=A0A6A5W7Q9_9PLEO|nr:Fe superoxide dismutase-like protein [Amniculicola lignicola CBS 123094]
MIIRSLCRRPAALGPLARCRAAPIARQVHTVPTLQNHAALVKHGIPPLLSRAGFAIAYTDYMDYMVGELNAVTAHGPWENQPPKNLVIEWARSPVHAFGFNVASTLFNNDFFFKCLATDPDVPSAPSELLTAHITASFSSLSTLRDEMLATADAMFGPGYVWLVQVTDASLGRSQPLLRILPTYLAGTPLSGAHYRRQPEDLNTHNADSVQQLNTVGSFGSASAAEQRAGPKKPLKPLGGVDVTPLLCVSTWEHVWLHDYGVAGKTKFLDAWWDKIDWSQVEQAASLTAHESKPGQQGQQQFFYS